MGVWSYKLFKPRIPILASHLCFIVKSNENHLVPNSLQQQESSKVQKQGIGSDSIRCTEMSSIKEDLHS